MIPELLPALRTPVAGRWPVTVATDRPVDEAGGRLLTATLVGPGGTDPSVVEDGIWQAMGPGRAPRTLAQLSNLVPPTPQLYERVWRVRSLGLLSGRAFPVAEELAELDTAVGPTDGAVVVDVGCSEGLYARHLAGRGALVAAVDHSVPFLRRAARRAGDDGVRLGLVRATAQRLPLLDAAADAVVIGGSLNEIGDVPGALAEAARVLRPGGRMFVMSLVTATTRRGRALQAAVRPSGIVFPTLAGTGALFSAAGFELEDQRVDRVVVRSTLRRRS